MQTPDKIFAQDRSKVIRYTQETDFQRKKNAKRWKVEQPSSGDVHVVQKTRLWFYFKENIFRTSILWTPQNTAACSNVSQLQ